MYLQEAFRALGALNEDTFSVSDDGINKLAEFQNNDDLEDEIKVIDPDAETEEDLQDSYVGKVILDCAVCHSKLYKDKEEVELDEEGDMANVGEECPYCYTSDGFKVIGEVAAFGKAEEAEEDEASEEEEKKDTETEEDDDKVEESLTKTPSKEEITDPKSEPSSKQLSEKFFKSRKRIRESSYEDTDGIMGEKGTKWTEDQLRTYFDSEKDNDPVLKAYNGNADKWMQDTLKGMKKVNESVKVNGENLSYAVINPDGTYAGAPCTSEEEARELAAQKEGRVVVKLKAVKNKSKSIKESIENRLKSRILAYARHNSDDSEPKYFWIGFSTAVFQDTLTQSELLSMLEDHMDETDPEYSDFLRGFEDNGGELLVDESKSINESVNNVNVETDDSIVNVSTDDNGKVTVTTEPNTAPVASGDEIIAPVSPETQAEIEMGSEEAPIEDEFVDMEVDEFDEESFDGLGESYLKKVYENVDSYKTTSIKENGNSIVVEGVINFKSGKAGKTSFLFEAKDCTKDGRVRFVGENAQLTKGKKSFTISGKVADKKFITESFNYNYRAKDKDGKSSRVYGTIKK